jgi:hypothetical protein
VTVCVCVCVSDKSLIEKWKSYLKTDIYIKNRHIFLKKHTL